MPWPIGDDLQAKPGGNLHQIENETRQNLSSLLNTILMHHENENTMIN
jgi:hypothetical protein